MSLISATKHINELKKLQSDIKLNVVKGVKTADYPYDSFEGIRNTAKKTNFYSKIKNYFSELFVAAKRPCIKPKPTKILHAKGSKPIIEGEQTYNYIDCDNARIMKKHNPTTLKKAALPKDKTVLHVSNFDYPYGSIGAATDLKGCIATGKLLQCAGVAVVDKSNNTQALIHCYPWQSVEDFSKLLKHFVPQNNKNAEITIIPGAPDNCDMTISAIVDVLKHISPDNKVKFANFSKDVRIFDRAVVLQDGKLTCCPNSELENLANKVTNPKDEISYIVDKFNSQ